jgi:hypothetical protein
VLPRSVLLAAVPFLVVAACATERERSDDDDDGGVGASGSGAGAGVGGAMGGAGAGAGGSASGGSGGSAAAVPVCQPPCAGVSDCVVAGGGAFDEDNYECVDDDGGGHCRYLDDAECMLQGNYVCGQGGELMLGAVDVCVLGCTVAADCDIGGGIAYDADNYECLDGGCRYTGCNGDAECQALGNYVCRDVGTGTSYCQIACVTPADCDLGAGAAYDADNYSCDDGTCRYLGCHNDEECASIGYRCVE